MKELLEQYFGKHYGSPKQALAESEIKNGVFELADMKACGDCKTHTPEIEAVCDKTVLIIDSNGKDVECIQLERFIDNYTHLKAIQSGKKCDLMLVGEDKVVLCDMTCSKAKYIDPFDRKDGSQQTGKRNTVRKQIANAILLLRDVPEIASGIDKRVRKIALFAYRVKDSAEGMDDFDGKVRSGMRFFSEPAERLISEPMYAEMEGGFVFTEIRYPNKYMW